VRGEEQVRYPVVLIGPPRESNTKKRRNVCPHRDPVSGAFLPEALRPHWGGVAFLVLEEWRVAPLRGLGLLGRPLHLPGLVVQEDPEEHEQGADGAEDADLVAEHEDAQPDGQGVLNGAGHTGEEVRVVVVVYKYDQLSWTG